MINERSIEFARKFFKRASELNRQGVRLVDGDVDLNIDKAMLCIISVPNSDDDVIVVLRHMSQVLIELDSFMSAISAFDLNATWAYQLAVNVTKVFNAKRNECYVNLKENRGDCYASGDSRVNQVFKGHQGRMD